MEFLFCIAIVWIIKDSFIFLKPRNYLKSKSIYLKELLSCSLCLGFWVGLLVSILEFLFNDNRTLNLLYIPFASSALCWFFDSLLDLIQECWVYLKNINKN